MVIETFDAFKRCTSARRGRVTGEGKTIRTRERTRPEKREGELDETGNWIGFLLIKISNLTPECAVFNETPSGRGFLSHYSRGCGLHTDAWEKKGIGVKRRAGAGVSSMERDEDGNGVSHTK